MGGLLLTKTYYLFLDETVPNAGLPAFCLAGCIVEETAYQRTLVPAVQQLKDDVFGTQVVLHEVEIRKKQYPYRALNNPAKWDRFWNGMSSIMEQPGLLHVLGAAIRVNDYQKYYPDSVRADQYLVAFQIILENFAHFLERADGKGLMFLESRNPTEDKKVQHLFHTIKVNGTLFLQSAVLQDRLATISFPLKSDNNIGLQIADFIPNSVARFAVEKDQKSPTLLPQIRNTRYDGHVGLPERFGIKIMP